MLTVEEAIVVVPDIILALDCIAIIPVPTVSNSRSLFVTTLDSLFVTISKFPKLFPEPSTYSFVATSVACDGVLTPDNLCPPNEITVESLEVITLPAISIDPSVMLDSAKFIDDESSEETVVPFILKAPTTMCPVPDAEMFISSFDLVPVILLSLIFYCT